MTFGQFFSILRARWFAALVVFVLTVGLTVGISLLWPKKYTAVASVVLDPKPDPISAVLYPGMASPAFMATQVDIIQSDRVALRVVRNLKLAENPQVRAQWQEATEGRGSIESWLADSFQKNMDVKPSKESNVLSISYKAPDPRFAAALANAFVQAYIDTVLELRVDPAKLYSSFFDTRLKDARSGLEKAQAKLSAFQKDNSIIASDERLDVENARLNELSTQLVMLQAASADSVSRQTQAQGGSAERMQEVLNSPLISGMKADLARSEARMQELNSKFGVNHPQVIEAMANITELRTRLDAEIRKVTGGVTITNNINRQRESQIRTELEAQRAKVLRMKQTRDESAVLARDVENAQRAYDAVQSRLTQSSLESQTTQSNVNFLTSAVPPNEPSSPRILLNSLIAVFAGTMLGIGVAMVRELMDRRVRGLEDISLALGVPVLGVMPKPATRLAGRKPSLMQQRVLGRLPAAGKGA